MIEVTNIAKDKVCKIPVDAPLISISDRYSVDAVIPNEKNRPLLRLDFFPGDHIEEEQLDRCMTPERAKRIFDFMSERKDGEVVYIQCGEGRIRSYTLCIILELLLYPKVRRNSEFASIKRGVEDTYTARVMAQYHKERIESQVPTADDVAPNLINTGRKENPGGEGSVGYR